MNQELLNQLTIKALDVVLFSHKGLQDEFFAKMSDVIKAAFLEGKIEALKQAKEDVKGLSQQ